MASVNCRRADKRADIWAFGLVLYEALSSHRAFEGRTDQELLQNTINRPPEPLPKALPAPLRMIVRKTLEKKAENRYQSARDLVVDLRRLTHQPDEPTAHPSLRRNLAFGFLAVASVVVSLFVRSKSPSTPVPLQYTQITDFTDSARAPALSRDGKMMTFMRGGEFFQSSGQIYIKPLPAGDAKQLTDQPDLKYGPVFTPDGSRVAYTLLTPGGSWETWTVPVSGGNPTRLLSNASGLNGSSDGKSSFRRSRKERAPTWGSLPRRKMARASVPFTFRNISAPWLTTRSRLPTASGSSSSRWIRAPPGCPVGWCPWRP